MDKQTAKFLRWRSPIGRHAWMSCVKGNTKRSTTLDTKHCTLSLATEGLTRLKIRGLSNEILQFIPTAARITSSV